MVVLKKIYGKLKNLKLRCYSKIQLVGVNKGKNNNVFGRINIVCPENLSIGKDCTFNHGCYINAGNPIHIGSDVIVSAKALIISTGVNYSSWAIGEKKHTQHSGITINSHVWIGAGASIIGNINITGKYIVIAAGAVVVKDITEDYCIVAGCPAKIIKYFTPGDN